jgi:NAD(P)-dependent dehydrogenase (short-subunit alcohol dehydrogenase family)
MAGELAGKVAIVTGGASGMGRGMVERFAAEGAKVVIADVQDALGEEVAAKVGASVAYQRTDVSDTAQLHAVVDFAVKKFGGLHIMANNAGISGKRSANLLEEDFGDFHKVFGINLLGVMAGTGIAAKAIAKCGGGSIINTSSIGGMQGGTSLWAYGASKAAVIHFTKASAIELGNYNIRANCICPGNIETPIMGNAFAGDMSPEDKAASLKRIRAYLIERQPLARQGETEDIAQAALFYASDRSRYITGTIMPVDGGLVAGSPNRGGGFTSAVKG